MNARRILYIGDLRDGQTAKFRMDALARLGHQITAWHRPQIGRREKFSAYPFDRSLGLNQKLRELDPDELFDICWIDKAGTLPVGTAVALRKRAKSMVHFTGDTPMGSYTPHDWRGFSDYAGLFDYHFVVKRSQILDISAVSNAKVLFIDHGYAAEILWPRPTSVDPTFDLVFVGVPHGHRGTLVSRIAEIAPDLSLAVFGNGWTECLGRNHGGRVTVGPPQFGNSYRDALWSGRAALALVTHWNEDDTGHRLVEIAAAGVPVIGEFCAGHERILRTGIEALSFLTPEEAVDCVRVIKENPLHGRKLTARALERLTALELSYFDIVRRMLVEIQ